LLISISKGATKDVLVEVFIGYSSSLSQDKINMLDIYVIEEVNDYTAFTHNILSAKKRRKIVYKKMYIKKNVRMKEE